MKITNLAILFVCIFLPFMLVLDMRTRDQETVLQLEVQYSAALRTAIQDAGKVLNMNELQEYEAAYESDKFFKVNKELALDTFFRTLYLNFGVENDPIGQGTLASYIPVIGITDYDGYYLYTMTEYTDTTGQTIARPMWRPKKPYAYSDSRGNTINFTLDSYVYAYDADQREWIQGYREDLAGETSIPLLNDTANFDTVRRSTIVRSMQEDFAYFINAYNEYATRYGISYTFKLPEISQEEWTNTISDIGIMAFIQGMPVGHQTYNNYAFGGGRLVKKTNIIGAIDPQTGIKYYYKARCSFPYDPEENFDNAKDAAAAGYFPKECVNE
ncbi:hypothetical protein KB559_16455 [Paenibacillus sp. Marseille-P2973]|uniref:hypothetical protein n=1 Tax=Paenibacillus sp. Marseille-P2973 TaxID=1871032 RepID=UPI001B373862|nr:hypothetical protein [Paenibacillus sp. Marseille-P2973]MBQ4900429.1 hypothetical protein [Paenibacillus sp. Marseille-P2973]